MNDEPKPLAPGETWQKDGHVTEAVITALADGQASVATEAAALHVQVCEACGRRLGEAALLSLEVGERLASAEAAGVLEPAPASRRLALPLLPVAAALVLAALGMAPLVGRLPAWLAALASIVAHDLPVLVRSGAVLARSTEHLGPAITTAWFAAALVLVAMGIGIARAVPRTARVEGVVR
jgi:hypothetical protein